MALYSASVLVGVLLGAGGLADAPPGCSSLTIEARYLAVPEPSMLFEVRSAQRCTMYEADLPWGNFYSVQLSVRGAAGKVCSRLTAPIDDPADTAVSLKQGEPISGRVPLTPHCPALAALLAKGPVTVNWQYTGVIHRVDAKGPKGRIVVPQKR